MVDQLVFLAVLEGAYAHAHSARFSGATGLQEYVESPARPIVVEELDATTPGRIVVDYGS